ncbi:MAG: diguanylate cyclase [Dehalococcoidia bacterium]
MAERIGDGQITPSGQTSRGAPQAETPLPERVRETSKIYRSYYRWLRLSRLFMGVFLLLAAAIGFWLIPWIPSGMDPKDYTPAVSFTIYLLSAVGFMGIATLALRERAWRQRETLVAWSAVYDEATGLHHRTYLYDRLSLECERAERTSTTFSVLLLHIRLTARRAGPAPSLSTTALQQIAEIVNPLTHLGDLVALLSGSELVVVTNQADRAERDGLLDRLRTAVTVELPGLAGGAAIVGVAGGVGTYGVDGKDAESLIKAARAAAALAAPLRTAAA